MKLLIFLLNLILVVPCVAAQPLMLLRDSGRSFGIMVGDTLAHRYVIKCDADSGLIESSLPVTGELNYWLSLVNVDVEHIGDEDHCLYNLELVYQTFYAPLDVRVLEIPAINLQFEDLQQQKATIEIPAWTFTMSPIKQIQPSGVGGDHAATSFMQKSISPSPMSTFKDKQLQIISLCLLVLSFLILSWLFGWISLGQGSPFLKAKKRIKQHLSISGVDQAGLQQCFLFIHEAFNQRAGYTLFESNLDVFFEQQPQLDSLRAEVEAFYQQSQASFFFNVELNVELINKAQLLCQRLAMADKVR